MDIELPFDFKEFLRLLNENGIRYLLIGGYAVSYHGYPRATNDMMSGLQSILIMRKGLSTR